jgi:hypothetical protein
MSMDVNQKYCQSCHLISRNGFHYENNELTNILLRYGQCYHVIRMQLRRPESTQSDFQKDTNLGHVSYLSSTAEK